MENGRELFYQAVSTILFCIAVSLLVRQARDYQKLTVQVKEAYQGADALYNGEYEGTDEVSYAELVCSLFQTLEYDIEINGLLISKYEHSAVLIDSYHIAVTNYKKIYDYDGNGAVTRIIYTSVLGG